MAYDGAGRLVATSPTDGGGDSSWADADDVTGDAVLEQAETHYDADGNALLTTTFQRFHDQFLRVYNGLGRFLTEYQAHSGAVNTATAPKVPYAYSAKNGGANHSRLVSMTY